MNSSILLHLPQHHTRVKNDVSIDGQNKRKRRRCIKSVKFSHLDTVHTIPPCRDIDKIEKELRWYTREELNYSKNAARFISRVWKCRLDSNSSDEHDGHKINNLQQCSVLRTKMQKEFIFQYPMKVLCDFSGCSSISNHFDDVCELDYSPHGLEHQIRGIRFQIKKLVIQLTLLFLQHDSNSMNIKDNHKDIARSIVIQCNEWTMRLALLSGTTDELRASHVKLSESYDVAKNDVDLIEFHLPFKFTRLLDRIKQQQVDLSKIAREW